MKNMTLGNIAQAVGGVLHMEGVPADGWQNTAEALGVVHDSRQVERGFVFIATTGEREIGRASCRDRV